MGRVCPGDPRHPTIVTLAEPQQLPDRHGAGRSHLDALASQDKISAKDGGKTMRKTYSKPTLLKREALSAVTADGNLSFRV